MQERLEIYPLEDNDVKLLHIPYSYSGDFFPKKSSHHALDMTVMYVNSFIFFFSVGAPLFGWLFTFIKIVFGCC